MNNISYKDKLYFILAWMRLLLWKVILNFTVTEVCFIKDNPIDNTSHVVHSTQFHPAFGIFFYALWPLYYFLHKRLQYDTCRIKYLVDGDERMVHFNTGHFQRKMWTEYKTFLLDNRTSPTSEFILLSATTLSTKREVRNDVLGSYFGKRLPQQYAVPVRVLFPGETLTELALIGFIKGSIVSYTFYKDSIVYIKT